jgi:hypothetical protein
MKAEEGTMESADGRMKGDSNGKDEKMRAENGRIKGDLLERVSAFIIQLSSLPLSCWKNQDFMGETNWSL